jgi:hypothetical protein
MGRSDLDRGQLVAHAHLLGSWLADQYGGLVFPVGGNGRDPSRRLRYGLGPDARRARRPRAPGDGAGRGAATSTEPVLHAGGDKHGPVVAAQMLGHPLASYGRVDHRDGGLSFRASLHFLLG